jgi:hypothetical protein
MNDFATWHVHATETNDYPTTSVTHPQTRGSLGRLPNRVQQMALAVLVATAPIAFYDPIADLRRSGVATQLVEVRSRRRRYISIGQARQIALKIMADAEHKRVADLLEEARLSALRWNDEDFS